ncbi:hypothetical protein LFYK43_07520 [Ligilactobacillus salitolerans]|uniref:Regulatory protein YycH domain-containing protein n=1 Tax=Ligilactobacillus salitolerans TaxID=1808352 RepID=A0A401IRX8_9LACO|nr:hypothetical protein [Ligilactobacillus salitolerans]GBG94293.1 hypothetical protein LFYK43_07520 [Ligilactobacillus salitolerans]
MKIKDNILHFVLGAAVVLSVGLSAILWVNPTYLQNNSKETTSSVSKSNGSGDDQTTKTKLSDIYKPTSVIYNHGGHSYVQSSVKLDVIEKVRQDTRTWKVKDAGSTKKYSEKKYQSLLRRDQMAFLTFSDEITSSEVTDLQQKTVQALRGKKFNRVAIQFNKKKPQVYLLNDADRHVTKISLSQGTFTNLRKIVAAKETKETPIDIKKLNDQYVIFYLSSVNVRQYSYLATKDSASIFVTRLMGSSNSSVNSRREDQQMIYYDNSGQRMAVSSKTGAVDYSSYSRDSTANHSLSSELKQGFSRLQDTDRQLDDVRYDEYNANNRQVTYRTYINTYPILADDNYGTYQLSLGGTGSEHIGFSLYFLQVPVPSSKESVELSPTQQVLDKLTQSGISQKKINGIRIGYQRAVNDTSKQVVDLVPTYFVLYNGSWTPYQDILNGKVS